LAYSKEAPTELTQRVGFSSRVIRFGQAQAGYALVHAWHNGYLVAGAVTGEIMSDSEYAALLKVLTPHP
jgi:hypothetical protein